MPTPSQSNKVQVTVDSIKVPRIVLGTNRNGQEVYLYFDSDLERVVISGAMGLVYEQTSSSGSKLYALDVTSPSQP